MCAVPRASAENAPVNQHIALVGPTAIGKSAVAMLLAQRLQRAMPAAPVMIVGCDSVQIYRGFDCGSAKPSLAARAAVPHALIDCVDWYDAFDAYRYAQQARQCLQRLTQAGGRAIVCGGSGLYLRALRQGLPTLPPVDVALRAQLAAAWQDNAAAVLARLQACDPQAAAQLDCRNPRRVLRALEICLQTGEPCSVVWARQAPSQTRLPLRTFALQEAKPGWLQQRIAQRSAAMLQAGLLEETAALLAAGVAPQCRPMCAVGYKECVAALQTPRPAPAALLQAIQQSTWQYARRQRTWLRREPAVEFIEVQPETTAEATAALLYAHWLGATPLMRRQTAG